MVASLAVAFHALIEPDLFRLDIHELSDKIKMLVMPLKCILIWCKTGLLKKSLHERKVDIWNWRDIFVQQNARDFVARVLLLVLFINEKKIKVTIERAKENYLWSISTLKTHYIRFYEWSIWRLEELSPNTFFLKQIFDVLSKIKNPLNYRKMKS